MIAGKMTDLNPIDGPQDKEILHWISLLAGRPELQYAAPETAREKMIEWWEYSAERFSKQIPEFPEAFRTTRIWREVKFVEGYLSGLKRMFSGLENGALNLNDAVLQLQRIFSLEEERLMKWKQSLENLQGLVLWMPTFNHAREYLYAAFPVGQKPPDTLRTSMVRTIQDSNAFLDARERSRFDERFLEFKKSYIECYGSLHEAMRNVIQDDKREESKVDPAALRNLDLLSGLQYTDKSYLNRVNILAHWVHGNQCTLPVRKILERYPRCYCNFNPCANRQPTAPAVQINGIIQDGIEYFRTALRRCQNLILKEMQDQNLDNSVSGQIDTLLGAGPMVPLKMRTIETLNRIIRKNPSYFQAEIRKQTALSKKQKPGAAAASKDAKP